VSTIFQHNIADAKTMLDSLLPMEPQVTRAADLLADALLSGHKLLACGNGGSAADASHLTTEFVVRYNQDRRPYPAISFTTNGGDLTACGNDYSFDEIFARQVQRQQRERTSRTAHGKSPGRPYSRVPRPGRWQVHRHRHT
jgi:D-sedoheptulose 7-phosphate isomerase